MRSKRDGVILMLLLIVVVLSIAPVRAQGWGNWQQSCAPGPLGEECRERQRWHEHRWRDERSQERERHERWCRERPWECRD